MNKIKVRDAKGDFHTFKGDDVLYSRDGDCFDIFQYVETSDGDKRRISLASFSNPVFIKAVEDEPLREQRDKTPYSRTEDHIDPFTAAAVEKINQDNKPDYNSLARHAPIEGHMQSHETETTPDDEISSPIVAEKSLNTFANLKEKYGAKDMPEPESDTSMETDMSISQSMAESVMQGDDSPLMIHTLHGPDIENILDNAEKNHKARGKKAKP